MEKQGHTHMSKMKRSKCGKSEAIYENTSSHYERHPECGKSYSFLGGLTVIVGVGGGGKGVA